MKGRLKIISTESFTENIDSQLQSKMMYEDVTIKQQWPYNPSKLHIITGKNFNKLFFEIKKTEIRTNYFIMTGKLRTEDDLTCKTGTEVELIFWPESLEKRTRLVSGTYTYYH